MRECVECDSVTTGRRIVCSEECRRSRAAKQKARLRALATPVRPLEALPDTFWGQVTVTGFCWLWSGSLDRDGYGEVSIRNLRQRAHRVAYLSLVGELDPDKVIDHLCRTRNCVNPDHMEPVAPGENTRRGFSPPRVRAQRATCPKGHMRELGKRCSTCESERNRKRRSYLTEYMRRYRGSRTRRVRAAQRGR